MAQNNLTCGQREFESKLEGIMKRGVMLYLDESLSSPREIANQYYVGEEITYMPDYVMNNSGKWTEMRFHKIVE